MATMGSRNLIFIGTPTSRLRMYFCLNLCSLDVYMDVHHPVVLDHVHELYEWFFDHYLAVKVCQSVAWAGRLFQAATFFCPSKHIGTTRQAPGLGAQSDTRVGVWLSGLRLRLARLENRGLRSLEHSQDLDSDLFIHILYWYHTVLCLYYFLYINITV